MNFPHALHRRAIVTVKPVAERQVRTAAATVSRTSEHALAEIHAYIAIRDRLLEKAEQTRSECALDRAADANDFVANCVKPARSPYEAQHLPEREAARERQRCETIKVRIARLRTHFAHAA
jgi:hypothetical protein